eukprot:scaffold516_cov401-Prasinococcus_capsulatus_cf.AAC.26
MPPLVKSPDILGPGCAARLGLIGPSHPVSLRGLWIRVGRGRVRGELLMNVIIVSARWGAGRCRRADPSARRRCSSRDAGSGAQGGARPGGRRGRRGRNGRKRGSVAT